VFVELPHHLACLLGDPGVVGMGSTPRKMYSPAADLDKNEDVQSAQEQRVDGEEIAGQQLILLS
jgi:hypothetical protein